jgi:hypothetical protein
MAQVPFRDYAGLEADEHARLARAVAAHQDLLDVFAWGRAQSPPAHPADLVRQDEFTHDVLMPWTGGRWLVYGTTCLGGITGVSVWAHRPTPQEILDRRLENGWRPRPSLLKEGDVVEGFAACLLTPPKNRT